MNEEQLKAWQPEFDQILDRQWDDYFPDEEKPDADTRFRWHKHLEYACWGGIVIESAIQGALFMGKHEGLTGNESMIRLMEADDTSTMYCDMRDILTGRRT